MADPQRRPVVLLADDDDDDRELAREALQQAHGASELRDVADGQDLLDFLRSEGPYLGQRASAQWPAVILLDLNMPRKNGWETLTEIKADADLKRLPVVVLTTSRDRVDVDRAYELGASGFITKPVIFEDLIDVMRTLSQYWFGAVSLPQLRPRPA